MLKDRLDFLRGPGGLRAAAYFGLKLALRVEAFRVLCTATDRAKSPARTPDWTYLSLREPQALANLPNHFVAQLTSQCGTDPEQLLARGGSLHLLLKGDSLMAQLSVDHGPTCDLDSPPLQLGFLPTDAFLGYLYTWPVARRQGAAVHLINAAVSDLGNLGTNRVFAHVRATNVPSLAAFGQAGWKPCATLLCTPGGRLITAPGAGGADLTLQPRAPLANSRAS